MIFFGQIWMYGVLILVKLDLVGFVNFQLKFIRMDELERTTFPCALEEM